MLLIDQAIEKSRTTLLLLVLLMCAGAVAFVSIPKESRPDVTVPFVYVALTLDGIAPDDAIRHLVRPMERELKTIEGLKELRAAGYDNGANVQLEFEAGFDSDQALNDVREAVDVAKGELPDDAKEPKIIEINLSRFPVMSVILYGDISQRALRTIARDLQDKIEGLSEILEVKIVGVQEEQIDVVVDPHTLESYGLDVNRLVGLLGQAATIIPAGDMEGERGNFALRLPAVVETYEDLQDYPLKVEGSSVVRTHHVAQVLPTFKDAENIARINGLPGVILQVSKRAGENTISTNAKVRELVAMEAERWPQGLRMVVSRDESSEILERLNALTNNIISAILLVMIVILGVLGFRAGMLVGVAIPGSFLAGTLVLYVLGYTVNVVVLFGLILSSGMLVDGAIVVTESAERLLAAGLPRRQAYQIAAERMFKPIVASTATTLAAFFPLLFWPGIVGEFMSYLPITLIAILTSSLFMALVFVPVLGIYLLIMGRILTIGLSTGAGLLIGQALGGGLLALAGAGAGLTGGVMLSRHLARLFAQPTTPSKPIPPDREIIHIPREGMSGWYMRLLYRALRWPKAVLTGAVLTLVGCYALYGAVGRGVEFFPNIDPTQFNIYVQNRDNMSIFEQDQATRKVEQVVRTMQLESGELRNIEVAVGEIRVRGNIAQGTIATITVELAPWYQRRSFKAIEEDIRARLQTFQGLGVEIIAEKPGPPSDKPLHIEVSGAPQETLDLWVGRLVAFMEQDDEILDIEDSRPLPGLEWELRVDNGEAAKLGITQGMVGNYVQLLTQGKTLAELRPEGSLDDVDIMLRFPEEFHTLSGLQQLRVNTASGASIPATALMTLEPKAPTGILHRKGGEGIAYVKANLVQGALVQPKVQSISAWVDSQALPPGMQVAYLGEDEDQRESREFLAQAFMVALFLMLLILLTQFNNFFGTFLILSAVIMSTVGVLLGLMVRGQPFGIIMSGIGVIALAGIVVNNNIVLIDTFLRLRKRTAVARRAILITGAQRFRPVLLTAVTTILGLLPMVFQINIDFVASTISHGAPSTQWWTQLATAVVFGLSFSTVLTLIVTPCALLVGQRLTAPQPPQA